MDAGIILTNAPQPVSSGADAASRSSDDDAAAFAAHLDAADEPSKPRKAAAKPDDDRDDDEDDTPPPSYALSSPTAPVIVRDDGAPAVQTIALAPPPSSQTPQGAPSKNATPVDGVSGAQTAPPVADAAATPPAPGSDPEFAAAIDAALGAPGAANAATNTAAPAKTTTAPTTESPRTAGKARGAKTDADAVAEAKPAAARAQAAANAAQGDAKADTLSTPSSGAAAKAADVVAQPAATGEAAAVTLEARRAAEAPPLAVHRPPTVAATVAQHVIRRFDGKSTSIDVRLDPAELGRVSVKLDVGADSRVTAVVAADNPATLSDLMRSSRELERALQSAGLELVQGGLSFDLSDKRSDTGGASRDAGALGAIAGNDNAAAIADPAPASRPFGLESWRGVRVDVTV